MGSGKGTETRSRKSFVKKTKTRSNWLFNKSSSSIIFDDLGKSTDINPDISNLKIQSIQKPPNQEYNDNLTDYQVDRLREMANK